MTFSQLTANTATRVDLPGRYGPIAALAVIPQSWQATVLLVPGFTGSKEDFAPILDQLGAAGFRVLAIDLPGQLDSPGPGDENLYWPTPLGRVLAEVIEDIRGDEPLVLLGHSYGGLVSRSAVLAGARVAGLTLLCSGPAAFVSGQRLEALRVAEPMLRAEGLEAAYRYREALTVALRGEQDQELTAFRRRRFLGSAEAGYLGMGAALQGQPDLTKELAAKHVPVQVVSGADDDAWPHEAQAAMARQLGTELAIVPDSAHSPAVENPAGLLDVLLPRWSAWLE